MRNNLEILYHNYLKDIGQLPDTSMGDDDQKVQLNVTRGQNDFFIKQLYQQGKINDRFILVAIVLLSALLLVALFYQKQPLVILIISAFVLVILFQLKKFWIEKNLITISIGLMSDLPPKEAAVYIQRIYMQILQPESYQAISDFTNEILESPSIIKRKQCSDKTNKARKMLAENKLRMALNQLREIIDQHDFSKNVKNTMLILSSEESEINYADIKGIGVGKSVFNSLKNRVLNFCDEIDDEIEEFYQRE